MSSEPARPVFVPDVYYLTDAAIEGNEKAAALMQEAGLRGFSQRLALVDDGLSYDTLGWQSSCEVFVSDGQDELLQIDLADLPEDLHLPVFAMMRHNHAYPFLGKAHVPSHGDIRKVHRRYRTRVLRAGPFQAMIPVDTHDVMWGTSPHQIFGDPRFGNGPDRYAKARVCAVFSPGATSKHEELPLMAAYKRHAEDLARMITLQMALDPECSRSVSFAPPAYADIITPRGHFPED